ncbi:MAG TPA: hypothetical protein VND91_00355 [Candidatus Saccharimonadia bacterium]|nr:hypothetical protein [Candidatus Saccharimonadia bacterium]
MRLAIVTSRDYARYHEDDLGLVDALAALGVECTPGVWDDPDFAWTAHDALLVRTPWDYYLRWSEFSAFLDRIERLGVRVVNPVATLRWNADKRYLLELAALGLPVVSTLLVERGDEPGLEAAVAAHRGGEVVVKPVVSGGAWRTWRFAATDFAARVDAMRPALLAGAMLVQPYLPEIEEAGEWSLLFFGARYSHAVLKRPRRGDFRVQEKHGGTHARDEPDAATRAAAQRVVDALPLAGHAGCLYARVDGVVRGGRFELMELEVLEPQLFLAGRPAAARRFADVLVSALRTI